MRTGVTGTWGREGGRRSGVWALCGLLVGILTGSVALGEPPPAGEPSPATASTWSDEGLVDKPGPTAAGGIGTPLQGRYRTSIVMRRNPDGTVSTQCIGNLPGAADRD